MAAARCVGVWFDEESGRVDRCMCDCTCAPKHWSGQYIVAAVRVVEHSWYMYVCMHDRVHGLTAICSAECRSTTWEISWPSCRQSLIRASGGRGSQSDIHIWMCIRGSVARHVCGCGWVRTYHGRQLLLRGDALLEAREDHHLAAGHRLIDAIIYIHVRRSCLVGLVAAEQPFHTHVRTLLVPPTSPP